MSGASRSLKVDGKVLEGSSRGPLPASRKVYVPGERYPELRVPMPEISQTPTHHGHGPDARVTANPPVHVYDTSRPVHGSRRRGSTSRGPARRCAREWIVERGDSEELSGISSEYGRAPRGRSAAWPAVRFPHLPRRALREAGRATSRRCTTRGRGIVTPEMEFIAIRENQRELARGEAPAWRRASTPGESLGAAIPRDDHAGVRARRGGARPRDHPGQHQPPGNASR